MDAVARHYHREHVLDRVLTMLAASGLDVTALNPRVLAPADQFHIGGLPATEELLALAGLNSDTLALDIGGGLGGAARVAAERYGCRVNLLDITEEYCRTCDELSVRCGLFGMVRAICGTAIELPFGRGSFDVAWTQHASMNIDAKECFYKEIQRVLRPGGRFLLHDLAAIVDREVIYPVPWGNTPELSHVIPASKLRELVEAAGMRELEWTDLTSRSLQWYSRRLRSEGQPGVRMLLGGDQAPFDNLLRNLQEGRVAVVRGVWEAI